MNKLLLLNFRNILYRRQFFIIRDVTTSSRYKKPRIRKPLWLPVAASKLYRIPEHPYVPQDEKDLILELLDEYYIKVDSLRKLFRAEIDQKYVDDGTKEEKKKQEETEFRLLLESNKRENERIQEIREKTLEQIFEAKQLELLKLDEERKKNEEDIKQKVNQLVRIEKEKVKKYLTYDNLEAAIEHALDNPVNVNFAISPDGKIIWEGTPPTELENEMNKRISTAQS